MLEDVVALLRCPHGEPELALLDGTLACRAGHRFDVARQGYVNLLPGSPPAGVETAAMVAARAHLLAAGHQDPLTAALADAVATSLPRRLDAPIVDLGAGTGYHLAGLLEATTAPCGLAVDLSKHAARRAARAHPRIGAIVADVWAPLPLRDRVADIVLSVFAPRNVEEARRLLVPDGRLVVATPTTEHLAPLVDRLGLLRVAADKERALDEQVAGAFDLVARTVARWSASLGHGEVATIVAMGPSAWHTDAARLTERLDGVPDPVEITFAVTVSTYRPR